MKKRNPYYSKTKATPVDISDSEWKEILPKDVYEIARNQGTEYPFTGEYWNHDEKGEYFCAVCGNHLFSSSAKYFSTCGWPSFFETVDESRIKYRPDYSFGMQRTEILCGRCNSHLGHIFPDNTPTGQWYCVNSAVLDFDPEDETEE